MRQHWLSRRVESNSRKSSTGHSGSRHREFATAVGKKKEIYTWTHRSLGDGSLRLRTWERISLPDAASNGGSVLYFAEDGIHRLPFRIEWKFLALCQTILALPLVLLWATLRWRRKRAARRQLAREPDVPLRA